MACGSDGRTRTELSSRMSRKPFASVSVSSLVAFVKNVTFISGDRSAVGLLRKRKTRWIVEELMPSLVTSSLANAMSSRRLSAGLCKSS